MPEKEGLETIMELKRNFKDVKIIAISGGSPKMESFSLLNMAEKFGATLSIEKPFNDEEIINAVKSLLNS